MERRLIKAFLYSFTIAILVGIIHFPDTEKLITGDGSYTTTVLSLREYYFKVVRFAIKVGLLTLGIAGLWELKKAPESNGTKLTKGLLVSFIVAFFAALVVYFIYLMFIS